MFKTRTIDNNVLDGFAITELKERTVGCLLHVALLVLLEAVEIF